MNSEDRLKTLTQLQEKIADKEKYIKEAEQERSKLLGQIEMLSEKMSSEFGGLDDWTKAAELCDQLRDRLDSLIEQVGQELESVSSAIN